MIHEYVHKALLSMDPEKAHTIGKGLMHLPGRPGPFKTEDSRVELFGIELDNPLGLAAGFDKNGTMVKAAHEHGFGWVEIGSVTYKGGRGNEKPRLFRDVENQSLLNRMGLNGDAAWKVRERLEISEADETKYAINIAKTHDPEIMGDRAIDDISNTYDLLKHFGIYTVLNISCPNTREGKTFEEPEPLKELLSNLGSGVARPLLVKLSPNLSEERLDSLMEVTENSGKISGYVCGNTLPSAELPELYDGCGKGGISGQPIKNLAESLVWKVFKRTDEVIIGCGGVNSGRSALALVDQGAGFVQAYTGFIYGGRNFAHDVNRDLLKEIELEAYL